MQHNADLPAQGGQIERAHIMPVHQDSAFVDIIEARDQVDQRGLARTGWPDQGDDLVGFYRQVDIIQRDPFFALVAEANIAEFNFSLQARAG